MISFGLNRRNKKHCTRISIWVLTDQLQEDKKYLNISDTKIYFPKSLKYGVSIFIYEKL